METLIINIPEEKSALIKQILKQFGVSYEKSVSTAKKPSDYAGAISKETANELLQNVRKSRQEWERDV